MITRTTAVEFVLSALMLVYSGFWFQAGASESRQILQKVNECGEPEYYVQLDADPKVDNTKSLQDQLDAIPDGRLIEEGSTTILERVIGENPNEWQFEEKTPDNIEYVNIYLPKGRFYTKGYNFNRGEGSWVTVLRNRKYLRIHAEGTIFYTKEPAIPYDEGDLWKGRYSNRRHFCIWDSENIIINGLRIEGSNYTEGLLLGTAPEHTPAFWTPDHKGNGSLKGYPAYVSHWEFEHGFDLRRSRNITLNDCEVDSVWGDGFYVSGGEKYVFNDCKVRFNGRMAFATNGGSDMLIDGLYVDHSRMSGVDFENDHPDSVIEFVEVRNSKFDGVQLVGIPALGTGDVSNINIHHNDLGFESTYVRTNTPENLILRRNWRFNDNINSGPIKVVWMDNLQINRNVFENKSPDFAKISASRNVEILDNTLNGGNRIRTAMSGLADYEPFQSERFIVAGNTPEAVIYEESDVSSQSGKDLYEKMKAFSDEKYAGEK